MAVCTTQTTALHNGPHMTAKECLFAVLVMSSMTLLLLLPLAKQRHSNVSFILAVSGCVGLIVSSLVGLAVVSVVVPAEKSQVGRVYSE